MLVAPGAFTEPLVPSLSVPLVAVAVDFQPRRAVEAGGGHASVPLEVSAFVHTVR